MAEKLLMTFDDNEPPRANGDPEASFRRGFQHGAFAMLELIKDGCANDPDKMEDYVENQLREWRDDINTDAFPPSFKRDKTA